MNDEHAEQQRRSLALAWQRAELTWTHRATYSRPLRERQPRSQPLAALVELLEGMFLAPPDRLATAAEAAGKALGVQLTMYLISWC
jgi:hypothetical protein